MTNRRSSAGQTSSAAAAAQAAQTTRNLANFINEQDPRALFWMVSQMNDQPLDQLAAVQVEQLRQALLTRTEIDVNHWKERIQAFHAGPVHEIDWAPFAGLVPAERPAAQPQPEPAVAQSPEPRGVPPNVAGVPAVPERLGQSAAPPGAVELQILQVLQRLEQKLDAQAEAATPTTDLGKKRHRAKALLDGLRDLDVRGDEMLRRGYHDAQAAGIDAIGGLDARTRVKTIVDVGCSSGLSTRELVRAFPDATRVVGIDLSPHFIAVARHALATRRDGDPPGWGVGIGVDVDGDGGDDHGGNKVSFAHAAGERLPFEDGSVDLVSSCLVFHELPSDAAAAVIADAFRALRPGGYFTMMDMDPTAPAFERIANNVFAFTAFKSTEPYLEQYASLDVQDVLRAAGFEARVETLPSSPRHRTIVARKPCA